MKTRLLLKSAALFVCCCLASLRVALGSGTVANCTQSDLEAALAGGGTVLFACSGSITLTNTLVITQDTLLDANGSTVTISGGSAVGLFQLQSNVQFWAKGMILADGAVVGTNGPNTDPSAPGGDAFGAGILNRGGTVILTDCTLTNHSVQGGNAGSMALITDNTGNGGNALGAAICSFGGTLNLTNCLLTQNAATGGIASIYPPAPIVPYSGQALGGAIYSERGRVNLANVTVMNNSAVGGGTGQTVGAPAGHCGNAAGGAVFATNSVILITGSILGSNSVAGGDSQTSSGYQGSGCGDGLGGALFVAEDSSGEVQLSQFSGNWAAGGNGDGAFLSGAGRGGAVFNAGSLQVSACTFLGGRGLGGSHSGSGGVGQGGGVFSSQLLMVNECTFAGNLAVGGEGDYGPGGVITVNGGNGEGGAIWSSGLLNATNSTFAANGAVGGYTSLFGGPTPGNGAGGAVFVTNETATLVNLTIASNGAYATNSSPFLSGPGSSQGGGLASTNANLRVRNLIIANSGSGGDVWGTVIDAGYNICSDGTAHFSTEGSLNQADPMLSALSQNGGPTATMALLAGSPARDAIPSGFPPTDQRGVSRPQGSGADIGAFEADFISSTPAIVTQPTGGTVRAGTNVTFTVGASGTAPLFYQWNKDGDLLSGATANSLVVSNVQAADQGRYSVVVTNIFGSAASTAAVLVVDSKPLILTEPVSVVVSAGGAARFSVTVDGPLLSYQWWHDEVSVPGATAPTLSIGSALAGAQGNYFVGVSNFAGMATSTVATLSFDASALNILVPPTNTTAETGYPASFGVLASGVPPFAYQWQHNGTNLTAATNSTLTLPSVNAASAGSYDVVVTNGYRTITSAAANLIVTPGAVPPQLVFGRLANTLTITFNAEVGRQYRLLLSTNFTTWSPISTNSVVISGPVQFTASVTAAPRAFYRVVTP